MAFENCPMVGGGYNTGWVFLNWIIIALVFALIFWGVYFLLMKNNALGNAKKR